MATPLMSLPDQSLEKRKYVVPWKSRKEFLKIYHDIYGEDEHLHLNAIKRITTWKSRAGSKLSVAVENTGRLFDSILNHKVALREHQVHEKEDLLRASYGVAVIRFVNFVTERGQTKAVAQPVHIVARQFGIPEWIVRIRHDATHNLFPSLDMLSTAACWAVQYLKEEFWQCQSHDYSLPEGKRLKLKNNKPVQEIRQMLQNFKNHRFEEMKLEKNDQKMTMADVKELKHCLRENRFCFISCLLEDGVLVPMTHELMEFRLKEEDIMNQACPQLPNQLSEFWHPLFHMMTYADAVGSLAKMAMFSLTDEDCLRNYFIAGWLDFILHGTCENPDSPRKNGMMMFDKSSLPMKALLHACLDNTNKFTFHLIKYLLDREELGDDAYSKLSDLVKLSSASTLRHDSEGEEESQGRIAYSSQDEKEAGSSLGSESDPSSVLDLENVQAGASSDDIGWRICTDVVDWSMVPLGVIPSLEEEVDDQESNSEEMDDDENDEDDDDGDHNHSIDNDDDDDDEADNETHVRDWKRSRRKRSFEDNNDGLNQRRSSPKRSTYTVNDTELL